MNLQLKWPLKRKALSILYWTLLFYMVLALAYWWFALEKQNRQIETIRLQELKIQSGTTPTIAQSTEKSITGYANRKTIQYTAEGLTFLAFIVLGAVVVFRATRRQFRLSEQQQNWMMAITHELKTPIAVTRLNLETLQKRELETSVRDRLLNNSIAETGRLNQLCSNVLLAAQFDSGSYRANKLPLNIFSVVSRAAEETRSRYPGHTIEVKGDTSASVIAEEWLLVILVNNLLENAIAYSPREKPVTLEIQAGQQNVQLFVSDHGPGIDAAEQKKIFKKFYRTGNELTRQKKGTGLGLYLCQKIAEAHNARISVESQPGKGSRFIVSVPSFHV
jgi:signal transduction histidine kinase